MSRPPGHQTASRSLEKQQRDPTVKRFGARVFLARIKCCLKKCHFGWGASDNVQLTRRMAKSCFVRLQHQKDEPTRNNTEFRCRDTKGLGEGKIVFLSLKSDSRFIPHTPFAGVQLKEIAFFSSIFSGFRGLFRRLGECRGWSLTLATLTTSAL